MSKKVIELDTYKKEREEELQEAQEYFKGLDLSSENYINIMEKLKETKNLETIKEIPINDLLIQQIARKIEKKSKK
jgi:hypothetical protein